ncbi:MAG TPA: LytTR family DNA-binding domain-containing protein [Chitinophaga sp.]|uniref:LytR/AlgR family response regulator transcription factor n=1 Tax=Chitinophaga sp. TaxID=1869181 RepID=UPI002DBD4322|nr:LytTR family DNA-binding domain-containing protein [Chitinophaga sp.]HEU4552186.1 LytTR family DNA-binding domain-containing protein [Chitinophaga sp.]
MKKIKCIIVDDEPLSRELLENHIERIPFLELVKSCADAFDAIDVLQTDTIELLITDIQMPRINGLELIKSLSNPPFLIFATAFSNYAIEGYDLNAVDFLLKPISFERFLKAINKAKKDIDQKNGEGPAVANNKQQVQHLFVKDGQRLSKILFEDILYIEGMKDYIKIVTKQRNIVTYMRMKSIEEVLPESQFIRIHKSYIIHVPAIKSVLGNSIELVNNESIIISKQHKQMLIEKLGIDGKNK